MDDFYYSMFLLKNSGKIKSEIKATTSWNVVHCHPNALKLNSMITPFKLIIFYCLTTFYNVKFFKYFSFWIIFHCFSKSFRNILYCIVFLITIIFLHLDIWLPRKIDWCITLRGGGLHRRIFMKISKINTHVILAFFRVFWKRIFKNQPVGSFISFQILAKVH